MAVYKYGYSYEEQGPYNNYVIDSTSKPIYLREPRTVLLPHNKLYDTKPNHSDKKPKETKIINDNQLSLATRKATQALQNKPKPHIPGAHMPLHENLKGEDIPPKNVAAKELPKLNAKNNQATAKYGGHVEMKPPNNGSKLVQSKQTVKNVSRVDKAAAVHRDGSMKSQSQSHNLTDVNAPETNVHKPNMTKKANGTKQDGKIKLSQIQSGKPLENNAVVMETREPKAVNKTAAVIKPDTTSKHQTHSNKTIVRGAKGNVKTVQTSNKSGKAELQSTLLQKIQPKSRVDIQDLSKLPPVYIGSGNVSILMWTPLSSKKPHWNFKHWSVDRCPYKCQITDDRSYLNRSAVVLFRLRMLGGSGKTLRPYISDLDVSALPKHKQPKQIWVDVNQESPMYSHSDEELHHVDRAFDYIVSYHSQSDFAFSYIPSIYPKTLQKSINYAKNKTKMALWYVSHCDALSGRDAYVEELKKNGIQVDKYGGCSKRYDGCKDHKDYDCIKKFRSQYKFYLAFENSICTEYITEKFWLTLNSTSYNIPIALGSNMTEYKKYSPPNSYLHVENFTGAAQLAQFMKAIDKNDETFNSYHRWREQYYLSETPREKLECWLCRMGHKRPVGKHNSYSKYWSRKNFCKSQPVKVKKET